MTSVYLWALGGTQFIFLMTTLGAALVFFFTRPPRLLTQRALLGFAGGVMTAASVWSLLLPAIEQTAAAGRFPAWLPAALGLGAGALFLTALDALPRRIRPGSMLFSAITLHNIPEGMAVGLAFALAADGESLAAAMTLALGIGVQNFPEGAAVSLPLRQQGMSRGRAFLCGAASGAVEPVFGMLAVLISTAVRPLMPWLLAFSAGAMLCVTAKEILPEAAGRGGTVGYIGGFALMMVLDVALG